MKYRIKIYLTKLRLFDKNMLIDVLVLGISNKLQANNLNISASSKEKTSNNWSLTEHNNIGW